MHFLVRQGSTEASILLFLNGNLSPYCELSLSATLPVRTIDVNPSHIIIPPVPLGVTLNGEFLVIMDGFER